MIIDSGVSGMYNDDLTLKGVTDDYEYMGVEDEVEDILQGMDDEEVLDDLENYPEIMGEYIPEIMGKRRRRGFLARLAARRRKKMKRRIAKMSPKRRARWQRRIKRRKKIFKKLRRFKKLIPFLIPGSMVSKAIIRRKMKQRKAGRRGLVGRTFMKLRARRRRKSQARRVRRPSEAAVPVSDAYTDVEETREVMPEVTQPRREEVRREIQPAMQEVRREMQQEQESVEPKKGINLGLILPIAAAAIAIPFMMKKK